MFSVHIDGTSDAFLREVHRVGNIRTLIYISADDFDFPSSLHKDYPVIILDWWLENCLHLREEGRTVKNSFMDGPFEFASSRAGGNVSLDFYERKLRGNQKVGPTATVALQQYVGELTRVARRLVGVLSLLGVAGPNLDSLMHRCDDIQ